MSLLQGFQREWYCSSFYVSSNLYLCPSNIDMYWPKSGLFQWRIQKDRVRYLVITSSTAHGGGTGSDLEVLYLFSQVHLISQNCPQNSSNKNIPWDNSSAQHLLLEAKAQLSAHHQISKLFHYKHNACKIGPTILQFLTNSLLEGQRHFRKLCPLFPL